MRNLTIQLAVALLSLGALADDWPAYRHDPQRSAITGEALSFPLKKAWVYTPAQKPRPAWARRFVVLNRTDYDYAPQLVASAGTVCFGSSADDTVRALDLATGRERWHFTAGAPVRIAPQLAHGRVYFGADDGIVYCLNAVDGKVLWTFNAAPWQDRMMGNQRMMSRWPCRNGIVVVGDTLYAVGGLWPSDGVHIYALDAATGKQKWVNATANYLGNSYNDGITDQHQGEVLFATLSPQGPLLATAKALVVPQGHANPRRFRTLDGTHIGGAILGQEYADAWADKIAKGAQTSDARPPDPERVKRMALALGNRGSGLPGSGGTWATIADNRVYVLAMHRSRKVYVNAWDVDTGKWLDTRRSANVLPQITEKAAGRRVQPGRVSVVVRGKEVIGRNAYDLVLAGKTLIVGESGGVRAEPIEPGKEALWHDTVTGEARGLAVVDGQLLVSTSTGEITCFAPAAKAPDQPAVVDCRAPLVGRALDTPPPTEVDRQMLARVQQASIDRGVAVIFGDTEARVAKLLLDETELLIIVALRDRRAVDSLREKLLSSTTHYGSRITVTAVRRDGPLPFAQFVGNVVIVDATSGTIPPAEFYRILRPCGGLLMAPSLDDGGLAFLAACNVPQGELDSTTQGLPAIIRGQLHGARDYNKPQADQLVKWPLQPLWFGGPEPVDIIDYAGGEQYAGPPSVAYGRRFGQGETVMYSLDAYNGVMLWRRPMMGTRGGLAEFHGTVRRVVDVHPRKVSRSALAMHWRQRYKRYIASDDRHIVLSLGQGFFRDVASASVLLDAATGEQKRFVGPYIPGPVFGLDTPQTWTLNMPEEERETTPALPALGTGTADAGDVLELIGSDVFPDGRDQKMNAESGRLTMRSTQDEIVFDLKTRDPVITQHDIWELFFDFRTPATRYGLYGAETFGIRIVVPPNPDQPPVLINRFGTRFPAFQIGGNASAEGADMTLRLSKAEIDRYAGRRVESFDFSATLNACNQPGAPTDPVRQRHIFGDIHAIGINVHWARIFLGRVPSDYAPSRPAIFAELVDGKLPAEWNRGTTGHGYAPSEEATSGLRQHPLTGEWGFKTFRTGSGGCGGSEFSANAVFHRPSKPAIGVYDFADDSGLRFVGGVSWPCGSSSIAAMGLLNFKESRFRCDCNPPMRTSLALAPAERTYHEDWALFFDYEVSSKVRLAHLNLGAFGDRRDAGQVLWLCFPRDVDRGYGYAMDPRTIKRRPVPAFVTGTYTRHVPAGLLVPATVDYDSAFGPYRVNADITPIARTDSPWLYTSGVEGIRRIRMQMDFIAPIQATPVGGDFTVDGLLAEPCWQEKAHITMPNTETAIRLAYNSTHLLLAATRPPSFDRKGGLLPWSKLTEDDDGEVWKDDSLEVFLSDGRREIVLHLCQSASGARFDALARAEKEDVAWHMPWTSAAIADEKGLTFEWSLPLSELVKAGLSLGDLGINFMVNRSDTRGDAHKYVGGERRNWNLKNPTSEPLYSLGRPGRMWCTNFAPLGMQTEAVAEPRSFTVKLHFAELAEHVVGERVFDVKLQGSTVLEDFDVTKEAGGPRTAVVRTLPVTAGQWLDIELVGKKGVPILSALEIVDGAFDSRGHGAGGAPPW